MKVLRPIAFSHIRVTSIRGVERLVRVSSLSLRSSHLLRRHTVDVVIGKGAFNDTRVPLRILFHLFPRAERLVFVHPKAAHYSFPCHLAPHFGIFTSLRYLELSGWTFHSFGTFLRLLGRLQSLETLLLGSLTWTHPSDPEHRPDWCGSFSRLTHVEFVHLTPEPWCFAWLFAGRCVDCQYNRWRSTPQDSRMEDVLAITQLIRGFLSWTSPPAVFIFLVHENSAGMQSGSPEKVPEAHVQC